MNVATANLRCLAKAGLLIFVFGSTDVRADFNSVLNSVTTHWPLQDDAASTTVVDVAGSNNGTLQGGSNTVDLSTDGPNSWYPKALDFDGVNDAVVTSYTDQPNDFAAFAWFKSTASTPNGGERVVDKRVASGYWLGRNADLANQFGGSAFAATPQYGTAIDGEWHTIGITRNGTSLEVYLDGTSIGSTTVASTQVSNHQLVIGRVLTLAQGYFTGPIAGVMAFNSGLSDADFADLHEGPELENVKPPSIVGTVEVGKTVYCAEGIWELPDPFDGLSNGPVTFTYQWQRDTGTGFTDISGETNNTYALTTADAGNQVRCQVIAHNDGGPGDTATSASVSMNQSMVTPWDLGCKPYRVDSNFDCTKEIQDFLDGLEDRTWNGTLNLAGEFWRISDEGDVGDGLANDGICLKMADNVHGIRIDGGGGIYPRNYPIVDYDESATHFRMGRSAGGFLYGGNGDRTDTMLRCKTSGVVLDSVNFMGAIVTDPAAAVWDKSTHQANSAGIGLHVIEEPDGTIGPGKFWIPAAGFAFCDVGVQMSDSSETGESENGDNVAFGFVSFASCYSAGFKTFAKSNVNYSFQYVRCLGNAMGDTLNFVRGGNLWVWSAEMIAGGSGDAFLRISGNQTSNSATFKVGNLKWDSTIGASSTGPYLVDMDSHTDNIQIIFENVHFPALSAGDIVARLDGDVQFVANDWFRFRPGIISASNNGGAGTNEEYPTVHVSRGFLHDGTQGDSIISSGPADEIWTDVKVTSANSAGGRLMFDYEKLHNPREGDFILGLPTSDPGVQGAWYTDSGTVKVSP